MPVPMRADARRNLEQLLAAARDLVADKGAGVALEEVAQRAGVGIATLYRRFPDRTALLREVVIDALKRTRAVAEQAAEEHDDPFEALADYLRAALELRGSAVIPQVLDVLALEEPELAAAREASARATEALVDTAHISGDLPEDVTFADVGMMLVRVPRPPPGPVPRGLKAGAAPRPTRAERKDELARRHLELFIRGLRGGEGSLDGPALSRRDLAELAHPG